MSIAASICLIWFLCVFNQNYTITDYIQKVTEDFKCKPIEGKLKVYLGAMPSLINVHFNIWIKLFTGSIFTESFRKLQKVS